MAKNYKPVYRKQKTVMSTSVKVIIVLLVVIVITLLAFLIKVIAEKALDPNIVYPSGETGEYNGAQTDPDTPDKPGVTDEATAETAEDKIKVRGIERSKLDTKIGSLVLVNKDNAYSLPPAQKLVILYDKPHEGCFSLASISEQLTKEAYEALYDMTKDNADRTDFRIMSSYRDTEAQQEYYDKNVKKEADRIYYEMPGYSDHHTGLAFDVMLFDKDGNPYTYGRYAKELVPGIFEDYKYYGFIMRYPVSKSAITGIDGETNHFRYVGVPHSVYITDNNLCLEEYLESVKKYTYEEPLKITVEYNGRYDEYCVWYCGGDTVFVPKNEDYTISGDNLGGFIVTVKL